MTTINTYQTNGKDIIPTVIECSITDGIGIHVIGLIDSMTKEMLLRVCTALQSLGYSIPGKKIIINIMPYSPSVGCIASVLDTAVALAILAESGKCQPAKNAFYVGELMLNGDSVYNEAISKIENYHKANKPGVPLFFPGEDADMHPVYRFGSLTEAMHKKPVPDYVHGTFVIASTDILNYGYDEFVDWYKDSKDIDDSYEAFKEAFADENGEDKPVPSEESPQYRQWAKELFPKENSEEFWDWAAEERNSDWEQDLENIRDCKQYNVPVVITGALGLWDGHHGIVPEMHDSVGDAVSRILKTDCDDWDIKFVDGHIEVDGHHHDGMNCFEIHALSRKGLAKCIAAQNRYEDIPELKKHDFKRLKYLYA